MPKHRSLDHIIVAVRDVEAAMVTYARLGFTISPRMYHSYGTSNALIMFQHTFLELLGDFRRIHVPSFRVTVGPFLNLLEAREGMTEMAFFSDDAEADFRELKTRGIEPTPVDTFTRPVPMRAGHEGTVKCSVTLAPYPPAPALGLFVSHQHRPELVWIPEWQVHPNNARDIVCVTYVADDPSAHANYFEAFLGSPARTVTGGIGFDDGRGATVEILAPAHLTERFPGVDIERNAVVRNYGVGVRIAVDDLDRTRATLEREGTTFLDDEETGIVRVRPDSAAGMLLEFAAR